ncbi:hypothetical protein Tco_0939925 [Tanacetum coccineum]|uniref:Uncharacterized protein n=1 Tax=Tanacetum coccineum TaxID=301880 RepID=A0ABQ5DM01_9ASTR
MAYETLQKSIIRDESEQFDADKDEERTKKKSNQDSPKTLPGSQPSPPPPSPPSGASEASGLTGTSDSAQDPPLPPPLKLDVSSVPKDVLMHEESDFEAQDMGSDDEDSGSRHIPKVNLNQDWFKPLSEEERPATPEPAWKQGITKLTPEHLEGPAYEVVKAFHPDVIHLLALSITKMKPVTYPDVGLEQMVSDQMWAEEEYMYDILASYGISHWWFKRQQFYINRHSANTNRRAIVKTHMRILSVVRIEVFSIYGYDYMKKIVLRRADNQEYTIAESDFKDLYPSDFEDLYLLNL